MHVEVKSHKPVDFQPKMEASGCFLEIDGHLLLIQQAEGYTDAGRWGVPAGKFEPGDTPEMAAKRELFEETGIQPALPSQIVCFGTLYVRKPNLDYIYHCFKIHLDEKPLIRLSLEHSNYRWADVEDLGQLPLRPGAKEALQYYRSCHASH